MEIQIDENTSDGFHTFKELYEFRLLLNAALFNEWHKRDKERFFGPYVCKSKLHSDGSVPFGGGWFIVTAQLPCGQISFHYEMKHWDLFNITVQDKAPDYDGHTSEDVLNRLNAYLGGK